MPHLELLASLLILSGCFGATIKSSIEDKNFWMTKSQEDLRDTLSRTINQNIAKNVILFIGDGMGVSTVTAARILKGQRSGRRGEEEVLSFETFPYLGLLKTYSSDMQTADSAATATALMSGVKTSSGLIGLDSRVKRGHCDLHRSSRVPSVLRHSISAGKSTGIVTTTRVTHATPAAAYAFSADRGWEGDSVTPRGDCADIAWQLIHNNPEIDVILGGGRRYFTPANSPDVVTGILDPYYGRRDGHNLIEDWKRDKLYRNISHQFVYNNAQLDAVNITTTNNLLGLFSRNHMDYEQDRDNSSSGQPSLATMTQTALKILRKNPRGYFLCVEGGRIDHGHHSSTASRALHDTLAFEEAVTMAMNMTDVSDTLIVVTSDHSHVMTIAGYPKRGNPILGLTNPRHLASDGLPYTTLAYTNGPGYSYAGRRPNLAKVDTSNKNYMQASAVPLQSETHSGEDVAIYASGPMSHLFAGVNEQSYVAHVLSYASCVGLNKKHCSRMSPAVNRMPDHTNGDMFADKLPFFDSYTPSLRQNHANILFGSPTQASISSVIFLLCHIYS